MKWQMHFPIWQKVSTEEEGFLWKIWIESPEANEAGRIYISETKETAGKYLDMYTKRLAGFEITDVNEKSLRSIRS